jgi:hypothetical protein
MMDCRYLSCMLKSTASTKDKSATKVFIALVYWNFVVAAMYVLGINI